MVDVRYWGQMYDLTTTHVKVIAKQLLLWENSATIYCHHAFNVVSLKFYLIWCYIHRIVLL